MDALCNISEEQRMFRLGRHPDQKFSMLELVFSCLGWHRPLTCSVALTSWMTESVLTRTHYWVTVRYTVFVSEQKTLCVIASWYSAALVLNLLLQVQLNQFHTPGVAVARWREEKTPLTYCHITQLIITTPQWSPTDYWHDPGGSFLTERSIDFRPGKVFFSGFFFGILQLEVVPPKCLHLQLSRQMKKKKPQKVFVTVALKDYITAIAHSLPPSSQTIYWNPMAHSNKPEDLKLIQTQMLRHDVPNIIILLDSKDCS